MPDKGKILIPGEDATGAVPEPDLMDFGGAQPPQGPPQPLERSTPARLKKVEAFMAGIVADESLLMDLCIERAIKIVEWNHNSGLVGIDLFAGDGGAPPRSQMIALSIPIAVELYRESVKSVGLPHNLEKLKELIAEATA